LLRGLIDERDETLAPAVTQNIKVFLRVLMCNEVTIEVKEQIFEILAFVTDISSTSRE
jgi:ABC-type branched-subunit amino acid transport system ATPase component